MKPAWCPLPQSSAHHQQSLRLSFTKPGITLGQTRQHPSPLTKDTFSMETQGTRGSGWIPKVRKLWSESGSKRQRWKGEERRVLPPWLIRQCVSLLTTPTQLCAQQPRLICSHSYYPVHHCWALNKAKEGVVDIHLSPNPIA